MSVVDLIAKVLAIDKLVDYTASGIGAIAGPMLLPWRAAREAKAKLISVQADADARRIEAESSARSLDIIADAQAKARKQLVAPNETAAGVAEISRDDVFQRIEFQERKRLANIRSVVEAAADDLGEKEVVDHEPDPDWTARFFEGAQDISSEDMQKIWGKILAGEVERPGGTSLRTLDNLRNMTKSEAQMFKDACDFVLGGGFLFHSKVTEQFDAVKYSAMLQLQDVGLVNIEVGLTIQLDLNDDGKYHLLHKKYILIIISSEETRRRLDIPSVRVTPVGRELYQFVQTRPNLDYLQHFSKFLGSLGCQLYRVDDFRRLHDGTAQYNDTNMILIDSNLQ